jgi:hypothetical protein
VSSDARRVHGPGLDLHHEQDIQALQQDGIDVQEITRQDAGRLRSQELPPSRRRPARRGPSLAAARMGARAAGFVCPVCGLSESWRLRDSRITCVACGHRTSVTAGTIFDRTPLTVWFTACWLFATAKDGISALSLQRALEIGSCQTAWAMLARLRSVLVRPGRDQLAGTVEVGETCIGGEEPGLRGGRARGRKIRRHRGGGHRAEGDRPVPHGAAG